MMDSIRIFLIICCLILNVYCRHNGGRINYQQKSPSETTIKSSSNNHFSKIKFKNLNEFNLNDCMANGKTTTSTTSTTMPTPSEQQLEQFIQSLKPHNMDAFNKTEIENDIDYNDYDDDSMDSMDEKDFELIEQKIHKQSNKKKQQRFKAAVLTRYSMEYRPIDLKKFNDDKNSNEIDNNNHFILNDDDDSIAEDRIIEVISKTHPIKIHFKTPTNQIQIMQHHPSQTPQKENETKTIEPELVEPTRMYYQQIRKPIVQQIHEIIIPYRKLIQEIKPIVEQIHTVIPASSSSIPVSSTPTSSKFNDKSIEIIDNKQNRSPISRFKQLQQLKDAASSTTMSPLLIGVEQMVDEPTSETQKISKSMANHSFVYNNQRHPHAHHHPHQQLLMKELFNKILPSPTTSPLSTLKQDALTNNFNNGLNNIYRPSSSYMNNNNGHGVKSIN